MNVLAHANGAGWDELLLTFTPLLVSAIVFAAAKGRLGQVTSGNTRDPTSDRVLR